MVRIAGIYLSFVVLIPEQGLKDPYVPKPRRAMHRSNIMYATRRVADKGRPFNFSQYVGFSSSVYKHMKDLIVQKSAFEKAGHLR